MHEDVLGHVLRDVLFSQETPDVPVDSVEIQLVETCECRRVAVPQAFEKIRRKLFFRDVATGHWRDAAAIVGRLGMIVLFDG